MVRMLRLLGISKMAVPPGLRMRWSSLKKTFGVWRWCKVRILKAMSTLLSSSGKSYILP